jgi:hypothetical protein
MIPGSTSKEKIENSTNSLGTLTHPLNNEPIDKTHTANTSIIFFISSSP